mgnify:FL=1
MNLFKRKASKKQTESEKLRYERMIASATSPNTLKYTSLYENGLMHIVEHEYSRMVELGDLSYRVADEEEKLAIVVSYAEALNSLDKNSNYQLFVVNKRIDDSMIDNFLLPYQEDKNDKYRKEINNMIEANYTLEQKNFETKQYAIFTTKANAPKQAESQLSATILNFSKKFNSTGVDLSFTDLDGIERLKQFHNLLRPKQFFRMKYSDLALTGLTTKSFIAPNRIKFFDDYFMIDNNCARVLYIRQYPQRLEDVLIKDLCDSEHELCISIHARPYDPIEFRKATSTKLMLNKRAIAREQKENLKSGLSEDMISGVTSEVRRNIEELLHDMKENSQKMFSGIFAVLLMEEDKEKLEEATKNIHAVVRNHGIHFEVAYKMQEEALNTILPIGKAYLDVESNYVRDMTTNNLATQVPFSTLDLQDNTGQYLGKNQLSRNIITVNRKNLNTPSGLIFGSSGSGKGMTTKWSIISTLLSNKNDKFLIVDPENEYAKIGREFGAEILDIYPGSQHHLNILDMADKGLLQEEDKHVDLIKEKANLLSSLFESLLKEYTDIEASIVDRVTREVYEKYENPTLVEWYYTLKNQPEELAEELALKVEPYTVGGQDIFAHETNIDLSDKFVIFNIKRLDEKLKPFAMKVILDQIWNQIVQNQGKVTTWLFFDELQLNFDSVENSRWFMKLWSRVRKYGAIPTGITQNIATLLEDSEGRKMLSNSEFFVLLRQKKVDLDSLQNVMSIPSTLLQYVGERVPQGTGLISSGGVIVPFENIISKDTALYSLMETDA